MTTKKRAGSKRGATSGAVVKKTAKKAAAPARAPASKARKGAAKKVAAKKAGMKAVKKAVAKKGVAKTAKKATRGVASKALKRTSAAKKGLAKKTVAKKAPATKAAAKKASAKKAPAKQIVAKKVAARRAPKAVKALHLGATDKNATSRWDGAGHLKPEYAKGLRELSRESGDAGGLESDERAFVATTHTEDPLAEELGEEFVAGATSGEGQGEEALDRVEADEDGGPFVVTSGKEEFAEGTDASNPEDAEREPFPTV